MEPQPWTDNLLQVEPPALYGSRCGHCGRKTFPVRDVCPECHASDEQARVTLSTQGTLFTYTVIHQAPPGIEVPYVLGYVDLPEDDLRVLSRIDGVDVDELRLDLNLRMELAEFGDDVDGARRIGWRFAPATASTQTEVPA